VKRSVTAFLALAALSSTKLSFAESDGKSVQVLALQSDDVVDSAQAMTNALKSAVKRQTSVTLVPGDYSLEVLSLALGCPDTPDDACLGKIATRIKSDAFVWGTLKKEDSKLDLKLNLYRRGEPGRATEVRYNAGNVDDDGLKSIADRTLGKLLSNKTRAASDEAAEETGKLLLSADDVEGSIVVDGAPAGEIHDGHAQLELPVGDHDISVRADGYLDAEGTVSVSSAKHALLRLHPQKIGGQHSAAPSDSEANTSDDVSNASAGWGAIIVGGAFAVAGVYSTIRVNSINHDADFRGYRAGIPQGDDACTEANRNVVVNGAATPDRISDLCSQSKTFVALQYVFFGLGAVAAGTGALILLTDEKAPPAKSNASKSDALRTTRPHFVDLRPSLNLGPHAAAIDLRLRF
jgi:hypothetical protein